MILHTPFADSKPFHYIARASSRPTWEVLAAREPRLAALAERAARLRKSDGSQYEQLRHELAEIVGSFVDYDVAHHAIFELSAPGQRR
jgi:hypothetical protein